MNQHIISVQFVHKNTGTVYDVKTILPEGIHRIKKIVEREARHAFEQGHLVKFHGQQSINDYSIAKYTDLGIIKVEPPDSEDSPALE